MVKIEDNLTFPMKILGSSKYGSMILGKDTTKLCTKILSKLSGEAVKDEPRVSPGNTSRLDYQRVRIIPWCNLTFDLVAYPRKPPMAGQQNLRTADEIQSNYYWSKNSESVDALCTRQLQMHNNELIQIAVNTSHIIKVQLNP